MADFHSFGVRFTKKKVKVLSFEMTHSKRKRIKIYYSYSRMQIFDFYSKWQYFNSFGELK